MLEKDKTLIVGAGDAAEEGAAPAAAESVELEALLA